MLGPDAAYNDKHLPAGPDALHDASHRPSQGPGEAGLPEGSAEAGAPPKRKGGRLRILVVEDDPATAELMRALLEGDQYAVRLVASYREALQVASQWLPDLLISDIGLPGKDGLEVMKTMRTAYPSLRGLVVSGHASEQDMASSRMAGFSEHLAKPISIEALRAAIRRVTLEAPE